MAERNHLIRSSDCELSELAAIIKGLVETTQAPEYPDFELKPCVYELSEEKDDKFLHLWCEHWSYFNELLGLLREQHSHISIEENGGEPYDFEEARVEFESVDKMIQQLQEEEKNMVTENVQESSKKDRGIEGGEKNMENIKGNMATGKEQEVAKGEEKREHKVYLTLPPVKSKEGFKKMISNLKEAGAQFDSYNKHWYITPDADFNKFKGFLGLPYEYVNERGKNLRAKENERKSQEGRESVKDKLDKNRDTMEKSPTGRKEPEHNRDEVR